MFLVCMDVFMNYNKVPNFLVFILAIYVIEQSSSPSIVYSGGGSSLILVAQFIKQGPKIGCAKSTFTY